MVENRAELTKAQAKKRHDFLRARDRKPVKGVFKFHEVPGGVLSFSLRLYKGDLIKRYNLRDGEICTLPLGVARHLNQNTCYPVHAYEVDEAGNTSKRIGRKEHRCSFQSLEFMDIDDLGDRLIEEVTVTEIPKII